MQKQMRKQMPAKGKGVFGSKAIYLDYASLTPLDSRVKSYMDKLDYANPSSIHSLGVVAKNALESARAKVADILHAHRDEIFFTASGTEANNLAIQGVVKKARACLKNGKTHIIVSAVEHSSVMETVRALEMYGVEVSYIKVDKNGVFDLGELKKALKKHTVFVSLMMVNNEIGTLEPIQEVAKIVRNFRKNNDSIYPLLHTDACQAPLYYAVHAEKLGADLITLDGSKIYGPRGVGVLYKKRSVTIDPIIYGGKQESGLRSGTEDVARACGFAYALELADKIRGKGEKKKVGEFERVYRLKELFVSGLKKIDPAITINGDIEKSSPHILSISIPNIDNELFLLRLDARGVICSTKSACLHDSDESYVLRAISETDSKADRKTDEQGKSLSKTSLRFSFGRETTATDIKYALKMISEIIKKKL